MSTHPILTAAADIDAALKGVASVNPTFMSLQEKASALLDLTRLESRLVELRLRVLADADDVAAINGSPDVAAWLAEATRGRLEDARDEQRIAAALERRYPALRDALREGHATVAQTDVITRALDTLPAEVGPEILTRAEHVLVGHCADFGPRPLARLAARILSAAAPEIADEMEARRLAALEAEAHRKTRLNLRRCGDGTTRLSGLLPDHAATRLATYLEAFTNPRVATGPDLDPDAAETPVPAHASDPVARLPYPRRLGEAFCHLLESLDPHRLPLHAGNATSVVITIDLLALRADLATGDVLTGAHLPGDQPDPDRLTAAEVRRLACTADLIPAVLGTDSVPLDLGRRARLFTKHQRLALLLRDRTCRAQGCDIPGTWAEAHHWHPWSHGGPTDLDHGILLCRHHHRRSHDPGYHADRLPNGDVRFTRRP